MPSRYTPLTGFDVNDKKFFIPDEPVLPRITEPEIKPSGAYKKFSRKPVTPAPKPEPVPSGQTSAETETPPVPTPSLRLLKVYAWIFLIALMMMLWIWEIASMRNTLLEIETLKDKKLEVEKTNEAIRADIARLSGYQRIEKTATEKLHLRPAREKPGVLLMDSEKWRQALAADSLYRLEH